MKAGLFVALAACVVSLVSPAANAIVITGSFTGSASGIDINTFRPFGDAATRGTFSFETDLRGDVVLDDQTLAVIGQPVRLTFELLGRTLRFDSTDTFVPSLTLTDAGDVQFLSLAAGPDADFNGTLFLAGNIGQSLFRNFDLTTFDPTQIDLGSSFGSFAGQGLLGLVELDSVFVKAGAVPEPATWIVLLAGCCLILGLTKSGVQKSTPAVR